MNERNQAIPRFPISFRMATTLAIVAAATVATPAGADAKQRQKKQTSVRPPPARTYRLVWPADGTELKQPNWKDAWPVVDRYLRS